MTHVVSLRMPLRKVAAVDRRAADSGLDRTRYILRLLEQEAPPWLVCEPVLAEICASIGTPEPVLKMLQMGDLEIAFALEDHTPEVLALIRKYRDQGMDLADA